MNIKVEHAKLVFENHENDVLVVSGEIRDIFPYNGDHNIKDVFDAVCSNFDYDYDLTNPVCNHLEDGGSIEYQGKEYFIEDLEYQESDIIW